jgi:hypothetical protein
MEFKQDEDNLQFVLSSFSLNQLVETVVSTELLAIPVNHHLVAELFGVELTTTLLFPVIPELFYHYGHRNVSLLIKPLSGTVLDWKASAEQTIVQAKALASWIIHDDPYSVNSTQLTQEYGTSTEIAFNSILNLNLALALNINATKHVHLNIDSLSLSGFNVTQDFIGGSVKSDEQGIYFRLSSAMIFVQAALNNVISRFPIVLPELDLIDYMISFNYQDSALGAGINVSKKHPKTTE